MTKNTTITIPSVTYEEIVNFLETYKSLDTKFSLVSFCIGYYGVFTEEMWQHTQRAYADGYFKE